jgi:hypothetical protein
MVEGKETNKRREICVQFKCPELVLIKYPRVASIATEKIEKEERKI